MIIVICSALLVSATLTSGNIVSTTTKDGQFELLILHNNDMHARFEQTSQLSAECKDIDRNMGKCYGGFARVATVVKEARRAAASGEGPPVLYLNAGDTYTGTAWFTIYKWKIAAEFINALQPDAIALGNNEFTADNHEPSPFLKSLNTPILSSNVLSTIAKNKIKKSVVFEIEGVKVGIIGYLGLDKSVLDNSLDLEYIDEVLALKEEVANLQSNNVNIIIALGHSDPSKNLEIAQQVEGIDLVLGGHKNVFYWNGTRAESLDEAPITVLQKSGRKVPIIHSYAYNEHLGKLTVKFDKRGEITEYNPEPILLDASIPLDTEINDIKKKYSNEFTREISEIIGETAVVLDGESCKYEECNLGNFITDAIVYCNALTYESTNPWTDAPIAIIHGGAIASSIAPSDRPASITRGDLLSALPTEGNLVSVTMNGATLLQILENAASEDGRSDAFLQYSGIRVVFDYSNEVGSRVVSAVARCGTCWVPEFYVIEDNRSYTVIMPGALLDGFGYSSIFEGLTARILPIDEITCTVNFMQMRSPVYPEVAERIVMRNKQADSSAAIATSSVILLFVAITGCLYNY